MDRLPIEILIRIFDYLDNYEDLVNIGQVCSKLRHANFDNRSWQRLGARLYEELGDKEVTGNIKSHRQFYFEQLGINRRVKDIMDSIVFGARDLRYQNVIDMTRLGTRAGCQLMRIFACVVTDFEDCSKPCSLPHAYYCHGFLVAIKRANGFRGLVEASSHPEWSLMPILLCLDKFYPGFNYTVHNSLYNSEEVLTKMEAQFLAAIDRDSFASLALKEKALYIYKKFRAIAGANQSIRSYPYPFTIPFDKCSKRAGPIVAAILFQHFASLAGVKSSIIMPRYAVMCRIDDVSLEDGFFLVDVSNDGKLRDKAHMRLLQRQFAQLNEDADSDFRPQSNAQLLQAMILPIRKEMCDWPDSYYESCNLGIGFIPNLFLTPGRPFDPFKAASIAKLIARKFPFDVTIYEWFADRADSPAKAKCFLKQTLLPRIFPHFRTSAVRYAVGQVCKFSRDSNFGIIVGWDPIYSNLQQLSTTFISVDQNLPYYWILSENGIAYYVPQSKIDHIVKLSQYAIFSIFNRQIHKIGKYFSNYDAAKMAFIPQPDLILTFPEDFNVTTT